MIMQSMARPRRSVSGCLLMIGIVVFMLVAVFAEPIGDVVFPAPASTPMMVSHP
jgi:hypothetical protein